MLQAHGAQQSASGGRLQYVWGPAVQMLQLAHKKQEQQHKCAHGDYALVVFLSVASSPVLSFSMEMAPHSGKAVQCRYALPSRHLCIHLSGQHSAAAQARPASSTGCMSSRFLSDMQHIRRHPDSAAVPENKLTMGRTSDCEPALAFRQIASQRQRAHSMTWPAAPCTTTLTL